MIRQAGLGAACLLVAAGAVSFAAEEEKGEERITKQLAPDGAEEINVIALKWPAVLEFSVDAAQLKVRVTPDGLVELRETSALVATTVQGSEGNKTSFGLRPGQRVTMWPIEVLKIRAVADGFSVEAQVIGWAFVVRADETGREGLVVRCDDIPRKIHSGQRIDTDRRAGKVVFRVCGAPTGYPGHLVGPREKEKPRERAVEVAKPATEQAVPGVFVASARDFPWQSIPLPVLSWEVFRPADVSP